MTPETLKTILQSVAEGAMTVPEALDRLRHFPVREVGLGSGAGESGTVTARLDTHRALRQGFPEVILAEGKTFPHLLAILEQAANHEGGLLVTRLSPKRLDRLAKRFPQLHVSRQASCIYREPPGLTPRGLVGVLCAGASDIPVAEEAALTARLLGARVQTHYDAGVAGLHRLLAAGDLLHQARVLVVAAGMEGALPSVVGGLVSCPVIAVPTSKGYGAALGGLTALLGMLNSCSANVSVVNIDNGFGAGFSAGLINRLGG